MSSATINRRETPVTLIHHAAHCDHNYPAGSLSALKTCLEAGVEAVEIDVLPLADGSFALLHDQDLSADTNGKGNAPEMTRAQIENLVYVLNGVATAEKVGFLEEAIALLAKYPDTARLQIDLKPFTPLAPPVLEAFVTLLNPVKALVQVSSVADWVVRALHAFSPDLSLGFDPLLYLDPVDDNPRPEDIPPFRIGAYGLRDDHPLSAYIWGSSGDYFAARAAALMAQVPAGCEWFIRAELLKMAYSAGFDWIDFLHQHGSKVDGWTIDADQPEQIELAQFLISNHIDELTTNTPRQLADRLHTPSRY